MRKEIFLKDYLENEDSWFARNSTGTTSLSLNIKRFEANPGAFIFRDVPGYFEVDHTNVGNNITLKKVATHTGYYVDLANFGDFDAYFNEMLGSKSRSNFRRHKNRLEKCFEISYRAYFGDIGKSEYDRLFEELRQLLVRRFAEKQEFNYELQYLGDFHNVVFDMILERKANIFVIYHGKKPISIRINMFKKNVAYYIMSGYDIEYSKFHLGFLDMALNIEWMFKMKFDIYDLLKGYGYYKKKWTNSSYSCQDYYLYDSSHLLNSWIVSLAVFKSRIWYGALRGLKNTNLGDFIGKLRKNQFWSSHADLPSGKNIQPIQEEIPPGKIGAEVDIESNSEFDTLRQAVYTFLFYTNERYKDVKIYRHAERENLFFIRGKAKNQSLLIS